MCGDKAIRIDLQQVISDKLGCRGRYVPHFVVRRLERIICQDKLNDILERNFPAEGAEFCEGVLSDLNIHLNVRHAERLPDNRRCIIVSNHPLGGLDGIAMIAWLSRHYGTSVRFVVNDLLMAVKPLAPVFLPVNKHGAQSRTAHRALDEAMAGNAPIIIFPAGLVSRRQPGGGIADLEWKKMFVNKAVEFHRPVVPVHFDGHNSPFFYRFAALRKRIGLKFNIEMIYLPREVFRSEGATFTITCGTPVPWNDLRGGTHAQSEATKIREAVYSLVKAPTP